MINRVTECELTILTSPSSPVAAISKIFAVRAKAPSHPWKTARAQMEQVHFIWTFNLFREHLALSPLYRPPSPCPLSGEHSGYNDMSLESLAPSLLTYPSPPAQRKEGCGERAWKIWIRMAHAMTVVFTAITSQGPREAQSEGWIHSGQQTPSGGSHLSLGPQPPTPLSF